MKIKTFKHVIIELEQRDKDINEFEETNTVKATQTNITNEGFVISTVFYMPKGE